MTLLWTALRGQQLSWEAGCNDEMLITPVPTVLSALGCAAA